MTAPSTRRLPDVRLCLIVVVALLAFPRSAMADLDLPPLIVLQGFVKTEDGRAQVLVRVPLVLLSGFPLQRRGPGYIELAKAGPKLNLVAASISHQIELSADGVTLTPMTREVQLSLLSDRSFASYATALSHLQEPPLPESTDLFWNQGFFDVHFDYALPAGHHNLAVRVNVAPELGSRVKVQLEYLPVGESARSYEVAGNAGRIPLDPRWYDATWLFAKSGFFAPFAVDRLAFFVCLIAPFRRLRDPLTAVLMLIALQALTLTAAAAGTLADVDVAWLPLLSNTVLAGAVFLLGIANLASPSAARRWFIAGLVGALSGFGLSALLTDSWQFVGTHPQVAVVAFNLGVALGEVVSVALCFLVLRLFFARLLGPLLGVIVLSAVLGHAGWHGMIDGGNELAQQLARFPLPNLWSALAVVAPWLAPVLLVGVIAYFVPKRFDGLRGPTLLSALQARDFDASTGGR